MAHHFHAGVAELADALDLGSSVFMTWGFKSLHPHCFFKQCTYELLAHHTRGRGGMADALG